MQGASVLSGRSYNPSLLALSQTALLFKKKKKGRKEEQKKEAFTKYPICACFRTLQVYPFLFSISLKVKEKVIPFHFIFGFQATILAFQVVFGL